MTENEKSLKNLAADIMLCKSALIFCHTRPDGDTLGSAMALCLGLEQKGIKCDVVCDGIIPEKYNFEPFFKRILTPDKVTGAYACHIATDVASENMLGNAERLFKELWKTRGKITTFGDDADLCACERVAVQKHAVALCHRAGFAAHTIFTELCFDVG